MLGGAISGIPRVVLISASTYRLEAFQYTACLGMLILISIRALTISPQPWHGRIYLLLGALDYYLTTSNPINHGIACHCLVTAALTTKSICF